MPDNRRVVITGMGAVVCNGIDMDAYWKALQEGVHGIGPITHFDTVDHITKFGGEVSLTDTELAELSNIDDSPKRIARRKDRFVLLALASAREAMEMAGLDKSSWKDPFRAGVIYGAGIGGLSTIQKEVAVMFERGPRRVSPFLIPKMIVDSAAGDISIIYGAKGPNYCITTACATATHCMGAAFQHVRHGMADIIITGGSEASIIDLGIAGFNSIKALSKRNDDPATASRPFDKDRDGFVMAEGAGTLVFEELEHAKARGATIFAEVSGYGCTGDAFHETAPDPTGVAGTACMNIALNDAGIRPDQMSYINAHGTSTRYNDAGETKIIRRVFGAHADNLAISSTKSMTGHTLGAAGAVEGIATVLALQHSIIPPTINYTTPDPECDLDYVPNTAREQKLEYALSNNLGFGGHNASIIMKRFTD